MKQKLLELQRLMVQGDMTESASQIDETLQIQEKAARGKNSNTNSCSFKGAVSRSETRQIHSSQFNTSDSEETIYKTAVLK